jgi:hypothetical protein
LPDDSPNGERRRLTDMNKKFAALIIPLMLLPLVGFATAHWYDYVTKQYKMHVGTLCVEVTKWHIISTTMYDVDCDGIVFGDELQINNLWGTNPCDGEDKVAGVQILANPIFPSFQMTFEMFVTNKGQLTVKPDKPEITWGGPYESDPCWGPIVSPHDQPPYFQYSWAYYLKDPVTGEYTYKVEPTTFSLKPSETMRIVQFIHFIGQEYPELQCHWLRIDVRYPFFEYVPTPIGSYTWEKGMPEPIPDVTPPE